MDTLLSGSLQRRSKTEAKQSDTDQFSAEQNWASSKWVREHTLVKSNIKDEISGKHHIPSHWISTPSREVQARGVYRTHVEDMKGSFLHNGVQDIQVKVVMWKEAVRKAGYDPENIIFKDLLALLPPFPMEAIIGGHSTVALAELHEQFPRSSKFIITPSTVIVATKSEYNVRCALLAANLDNKYKNCRRPQSTWDCLLQIHNKILELEATHGQNNRVAFKKALSDHKGACLSTMQFASGTIGTLFTIAQIQGRLWDNIALIFTKDSDQTSKANTKATNSKTKKKKPMAHGHFCNMFPDVPENCLIRWTARVVEDKWTTKQFNERCLHYKKVTRVQRDCVEYVNQRVEDEEELENFNALVDRYAFFSDPAFFNPLVTWCGKNAKDKLSPQCKKSIDNNMRIQDNADSQVDNYSHFQPLQN